MKTVDQGLKSQFARCLGICRTKLYRTATRQQERDLNDMKRLCIVHEQEPYYGVERLATKLAWSKAKTRRIRNLAGITIKHAKKKPQSRKVLPEIETPGNLLLPYQTLRDPQHPKKGYTYQAQTAHSLKIWVQDFTYIWWHGRFYYLAITMSLATREVLGWSLSRHHDAQLVCTALQNALARKQDYPNIIHNDRGVEYMSRSHAKLCQACGARMSASAPGSPTQNGFMESFFSTFKHELGDYFCDAITEEQLHNLIASWIHYYNHERIHTALHMPPAVYAYSSV